MPDLKLIMNMYQLIKLAVYYIRLMIKWTKLFIVLA